MVNIHGSQQKISQIEGLLVQAKRAIALLQSLERLNIPGLLKLAGPPKKQGRGVTAADVLAALQDAPKSGRQLMRELKIGPSRVYVHLRALRRAKQVQTKAGLWAAIARTPKPPKAAKARRQATPKTRRLKAPDGQLMADVRKATIAHILAAGPLSARIVHKKAKLPGQFMNVYRYLHDLEKAGTVRSKGGQWMLTTGTNGTGASA